MAHIVTLRVCTHSGVSAPPLDTPCRPTPQAAVNTQTALDEFVVKHCRCAYPSIHFHCACRFNTQKLAHVRLLGPCFKNSSSGDVTRQTLSASIQTGTSLLETVPQIELHLRVSRIVSPSACDVHHFVQVLPLQEDQRSVHPTLSGEPDLNHAPTAEELDRTSQLASRRLAESQPPAHDAGVFQPSSQLWQLADRSLEPFPTADEVCHSRRFVRSSSSVVSTVLPVCGASDEVLCPEPSSGKGDP